MREPFITFASCSPLDPGDCFVGGDTYWYIVVSNFIFGLITRHHNVDLTGASFRIALILLTSEDVLTAHIFGRRLLIASHRSGIYRPCWSSGIVGFSTRVLSVIPLRPSDRVAGREQT